MSTKHASVLTNNLNVWKHGNQVIQTQFHGGHNVFSLRQKKCEQVVFWGSSFNCTICFGRKNITFQ
jgi:hypothetical protein